jgi:hypothetical protein
MVFCWGSLTQPQRMANSSFQGWEIRFINHRSLILDAYPESGSLGLKSSSDEWRMLCISSRRLNRIYSSAGRVGRWRGGLGTAYLLPTLSSAGASLAGPCSVSTSPPHQTGRADFPHPAFGQGLMGAHTERCRRKRSWTRPNSLCR